MNGVSLCSGVAGLELGLKIAVPSYTTLAYCERDPFAVSVLRRRIADGWLDDAPIYDDVETFPGEEWRGRIDIISGGFPCQPWSLAGRRQGTADTRWLWPSIANIIRVVRPRYVFLENVSALISGGGLALVVGDLAALGFAAEWDCFRASDVGAPHRRERVFLLGVDDTRRAERWALAVGGSGCGEGINRQGEAASWVAESGDALADACCERRQQDSRGAPSDEGANEGRSQGNDYQFAGQGSGMADTPTSGRRTRLADDDARQSDAEGRGVDVLADRLGSRLEEWRSVGRDDREERATVERGSGTMADAEHQRLADGKRRNPSGNWNEAEDFGSCERCYPLFPPGPADRTAWQRILTDRPDLAPAVEATPQPRLRGVADGSASRVGQLKAYGNAVVPLAAALAFRTLAARLTESAAQ